VFDNGDNKNLRNGGISAAAWRILAISATAVQKRQRWQSAGVACVSDSESGGSRFLFYRGLKLAPGRSPVPVLFRSHRCGRALPIGGALPLRAALKLHRRIDRIELE
jgi:hypothetical protein